MIIHPAIQQKFDIVPVLCFRHCLSIFIFLPWSLLNPFSWLHHLLPCTTTSALVCHLTLPRPMQDWLWGTPITNSDGTKVLVTTGCSRGYCRCQPWYTGDKAECRFTVSQDPAQRDRQCICNRQGKMKNSVLLQDNTWFCFVTDALSLSLSLSHICRIPLWKLC